VVRDDKGKIVLMSSSIDIALEMSDIFGKWNKKEYTVEIYPVNRWID